MFSRKTLRDLAARSNELRDALHRLNSDFLTGSDGGRHDTIFHIQLREGYWLSVSIPSDKNRNLTPIDNAGRVTVKTALFKGDNIVYDDELGYSDVRFHDFNAQAILAEYERLKAHLSKKV